MGLFKKEQTGVLGIDLGSSGIKVVELTRERQKPRLSTYGYFERPQEEIGSTELIDDPKACSILLKDVCKKAGVKSTEANASLQTSGVFSSVIAVQRSKDKKVFEEAIRNQVSKLLPLPVDEMMLDSQIIEEELKGPAIQKKAKEIVRVLVTAAPSTQVQKYVNIFKMAGLHLKGLEPESAALARSLVGKDKSPIMILDIGSMTTNLSIIELGIPFINRSIKVGGQTITQNIAKQFSTPLAEAETMKIDLEANNGTPKIVKDMIAVIINDIKYAIELFASQEHTKAKTIEKIILTGGSASLPRISQELKAQVDVNVFVGDPWARVLYPAGMQPVVDEIGTRMGVAVGLAMRHFE